MWRVVLAVVVAVLSQPEADFSDPHRRDLRKYGVFKIQCTRRLSQYGLYLHKHCMSKDSDPRVGSMLANMQVRCALVASAHDVRGVLVDAAKRASDIVGDCAEIEARTNVAGKVKS